MTITIKVGRRIPKRWNRMLYRKFMGFMTFQENLWLMIKMTFDGSSRQIRRANKDGLTSIIMNRRFVRENDERDKLNYKFEWYIYTLSSIVRKEEEDEWRDLQKLDGALKKLYFNNKVKMQKGDLSGSFVGKYMSKKEFDKYVKAGSQDEKSIKQRLLEAGIVVSVTNDWE